MIYADQRWTGNHGIGRFARHVLAGLEYHPLPLSTHPAAPLDPWRLARALRGLTPGDLFFSPGYNSPLYCPSLFIFTVHDLSHIYCPENSSPLIRLYYATILKRACRLAARILTVSEFTRRQLVEWSGVVPEKVCNVGCGVGVEYRPEGEAYGLDFSYFLCVSNRKLHKNEARVVRAFACSGLASEKHLIFTGPPNRDLMQCIRQHRVTANVHFLGVVSDNRLPSLYRGAVALIFASLYEGFGLPIVEAMACGIPVVTSNVTAMPEVAGGAALLVEPTSVEQIAHAMQQVARDTRLRRELRQRGLARARMFSWASTAAAVHGILGESSPHRST